MNNLSNIKTEFKWNGDAAVTLFFDEEAGRVLTQHILNLADEFRLNFNNKLIEVIPAYQSLTLCFDILNIDTDEIEELLNKVIENQKNSEVKTVDSKLIEIPVCYQGDYAPDLESLAKHCNLSPDEIVRLHTQGDYLINMLGFLPGFLYLSRLDKKLNCPRKETPSLKVPAGAVGIGGSQTGIYPVESPGGWHIIGRTPVSIFNPTAKSPFIAHPLDRIRFVPIEINEFEQLIKERA